MPDYAFLLKENTMNDDLYWFLDHWIIVRPDGTPVLNGTPEAFESALRTVISAQSAEEETL